jgi:C1A family cysteine protease
VPMPKPKEKQLGGHAVLAVGYDDATERFLVRNSWGPKWALAGYFTMPYAYVTDDNLSDDFWTIKQI